MLSLTTKQTRSLGSLLLVSGVLFIASPAGEWLASVWPIRAGLTMWRFGAVGALVDGLQFVSLGVLAAVLGAMLRDDRSIQIAVGVLSALLVAGLLAVLVFFALDAVQLRGGVQAGDRWKFDLALLKTTSVALLTVALLTLCARAAFKFRQNIPGKAERAPNVMRRS